MELLKKEEKVVVSGIGVVSSIGIGKDSFLESLKAGKVGIKNVNSLFEIKEGKSKVAYLVDDSFWSLVKREEQCLEKISEFEKKERGLLFLWRAVQEALINACLFPDFAGVERKRIGVILASSLIGNEFIKEFLKAEEKEKPYWLKGLLVGPALTHTFIQTIYGIEGIGFTISTACASGTDAIGMGYNLIKEDLCDIVITGGCDGYSELVHAGFNSLQSLDPVSCNPFSVKRNGTVLGEGAAILILERESQAVKRGVELYGEVCGSAIANDAYHHTAPDPSGTEIAWLMEKCLFNSKISKEEVGYINAHGTGTEANDLTESKAFKLCFGERVKEIYVNSTKGQTGHLLAAAGAIEALITLLELKYGFFVPLVNLESPDDLIDKEIRFITTLIEDDSVEVALSNSFGFGGFNACVVLRKLK